MKLIQLISRCWKEISHEAEIAKSLKYIKEREITALTLKTLLDESVNKKVEIIIEVTSKEGSSQRIVIKPTEKQSMGKTFAERFNEIHPDLC